MSALFTTCLLTLYAYQKCTRLWSSYSSGNFGHTSFLACMGFFSGRPMLRGRLQSLGWVAHVFNNIRSRTYLRTECRAAAALCLLSWRLNINRSEIDNNRRRKGSFSECVCITAGRRLSDGWHFPRATAGPAWWLAWLAVVVTAAWAGSGRCDWRLAQLLAGWAPQLRTHVTISLT